MKIAVIAAQGRSGQAFVQEALAAGHQVVAGVRGKSPFSENENLTTMQCDATDRSQVTALIDRCDAVVSLIGHVKGSSDFVQTDAMKALIESMHVAGVRRLVSLTGVGVGSKKGLPRKMTGLFAKLASKVGIKRLEDGLAHADALEASDLDWTVLKVLKLAEGEPGKFSVRAHGIVKAPTPRREVARAILQVLDQATFIRAYPIVSFR
jgi:nucleoside-diphosphate-sugar epimerase